MDTIEFVIRITFCFILCTAVGIERQYHHGMIGLRTNVLVGVGSFLFVYMSFGNYIDTPDVTRIAAQVVSGIGFLGAGVIIREGSRIKGLNTAATIWCVAALGVLTASGLVVEATIGTIFVLLSNIILRHLSLFMMEKIKSNNRQKCTIRISCKKNIEIVVRTALAEAIEKNNLSLRSLEKEEITKNTVKLKAVIVTMRKEIVEDIVKHISAEPGVLSISWEHRKYFIPDNIDSATYSDDDDEDDEENEN